MFDIVNKKGLTDLFAISRFQCIYLYLSVYLFSTASSSSENGEETTDKPAFRWDGTPLVDKTKESHFLKKVKSMEVESDKNNQQPPKPPIRDSSRKREEIK